MGLETIYSKFGKKNSSLLIVYGIIVLIMFPLQGIYLPRQYTKMIQNLTENSKGMITRVFIVIIIVLIVTTTLSAARETISIELFPKRLLHYTRKEIYERLIDRYSTEYKQVKSADTIERINGISRNITFHAEWLIRQGLPLVLAMLVIIVYFFTKNKTIGIIALSGFLLNVVVTVHYGNSISNESIQRESILINTSQKINNSLDNLKNIYINSKSQQNKNTVQEKNTAHSKKLEKELSVGRDMKVIVSVVTLVTLFSVIYFLYRQLFGPNKTSTSVDRFEAGAIIFIYLTYMGWMNELFMDMPFAFHRLGILNASKEFLDDIFKHNQTGKKRSGITDGEIKFKNVSFAIDNSEIITDESYFFEGKKITCIKGRSGSGKSITAQLIVGLYKPTKGEILLDGINIQELDQDYLRKSIIYVNQLDNMFEESVKYNMLYGTTGKEAELKRLLEQYNLEPIYETIGGIDTVIEPNGSNISTGMKKVIMVIRGILKSKATIYIFDEPTAGLDTNTTNKILEMIETECSGKTTIIITHSDVVTGMCQKNILISR